MNLSLEDKGRLGNNEDSKRKLVTIQKIKEVKPIKNADAIELVIINGWQCVSKKGEFKEGDYCIYFEIDSLLPLEDKYEFLKSSSYREGNEYNPSGYRLRTVKLRGEISQGLALPIYLFDDKDLGELVEGKEVSKELGVVKYVLPEVMSNFGTVTGEYLNNSIKTDELRVQSNLELLDYIQGKPYYISVKDEGTSTTISYNLTTKEFSFLGRNSKFVLDEESTITNLIKKLNLDNKLIDLCEQEGYEYILKGELVGPKVMKNMLELKELDIHYFTLEKVEEGYGKRMPLSELKRVCKKLGLKTVDIIEFGDKFNYSLDELLELAKGKYKGTNNNREGIVIRSLYNLDDDIDNEFRNFSFKVINNDYLVKQKD